MNPKWIVFFSLALLDACSVTHEYAREQYYLSETCCRVISEFQYEKLSPDETYIVDINEDSPSFQFATGKSYFISLELPPYKQSYGITIRSYALGNDIDKTHIFFPQVMLLDEKYMTKDVSVEYPFKISNSSLSETMEENTWGMSVKLEGRIKIDTPEIKYMIILTTDNLLDETTAYTTQRFISIILPGVVGAIPTYKETIRIPHSPFGRVVIKHDGDIKNTGNTSE